MQVIDPTFNMPISFTGLFSSLVIIIKRQHCDLMSLANQPRTIQKASFLDGCDSWYVPMRTTSITIVSFKLVVKLSLSAEFWQLGQ